ncbi:alpha/beta hydrolase [Spiribacter onubensis]|uniref:Alpha/beta fold hydrolase n=1 Tax=Spiribacter onubensis TaxID=3122420 RepID=A0ABV3S7T6_9GAMM
MFVDFRWPNWHREDAPALEILRAAPVNEGVARATPVVFVHGAFLGGWCWEAHFLDYFASCGFHAVAPSLRGHGGSDGHARLDTYGVREYVADLERVIADLDGPPPVLVGHSMGALVVQRYLERFPASSAVLMAPVPPQGLLPATLRMAVSDPWLYAQYGLMQTFGSGVIDTDVAQRAIFSEQTPDEKLTEYARRVQRESQRALWDMNVHAAGRPWLAPASVPMRVLAAEDDALFSADETRAVADLWGCGWGSLPGMGHAMMLEPGWQQAADTVIRWIWQKGVR